VRELEPKVKLDVLDPAGDDPGYWLRFRHTVGERAGPAMAERQRKSHVTMESVVFAWGRLLLPAVGVAVFAALLLTREAPAGRGEVAGLEGDVAGVEAVLEGPTGPDTLPSFLHSGEDFERGLVLLAVELR
jgi:hypothetical protein